MKPPLHCDRQPLQSLWTIVTSEEHYMTTTVRSQAPFLSTLPGRYYYDPAIYDLEQERIFSQMWVCVGRANVLPVPVAYRTLTLGCDRWPWKSGRALSGCTFQMTRHQ